MKKTFIVILSFLFSFNLLAQKQLTLEKAIQIALQKNPNLIKGKNLLEANRTSIKSAYGNLLPNLNASAGWNWNRIDDPGGKKQIDFFGNEIITKPTQIDTRSYSVSAGGNITLFDGLANYARISQAENKFESAKFSLSKLKRDIVFTTTQLYYSVIATKELVKVREENSKYNEKLLEQIKERNKLGSVPAADVYTQQVAVGNAQLLLIQSQNSYETALNNFLDFLALDIFQNYQLVNPYEEPENIKNIINENFLSEYSTIEDLVKVAIENREDYKSKRLELEIAESGKTIANSGYFPRLSGNYGFSTSGTSVNSLFERKNYNVGLTLSFPIFSNWNTEESSQLAKINYLNQEVELFELERKIKIQVKESFLNLVAAKKKLEVTQVNVKAAKENRKVNSERYNLGSGTILDVFQSDRNYTQALTDLITSKFEYLENRDKLLNAIGKLDYENYK
ncbi:MAG: hypothetical protein CR986_04660 [Ignavibacteriae bacterium]|nr:MAG: hypothetical protein CR986_04660 [Ignavibacteriota bacterium]